MKKNQKRLLTAILLSLIGFVSCSENGEAGFNNQICFYGESYPIEQGVIYHDNNHTVIAVKDYIFEDNYQTEEGGKTDLVKGFTAEVKEKQTGNFLLGLYESSFSISDLTQDARGQGACICLRLASPETEKIVPGKYVCSLSRDEYTFRGYSSVNYVVGGNTVPNELTEGVVNIAKEGDIYTIGFKGKTSSGGLIEGSYTGTLKMFDIRKTAEMVNFYENIKLEALFDQVSYIDAEGKSQCEPDYLRAASFFQSSSRQVYTANLYQSLAESVKKNIDLALVWDRDKQAIYFESPIRMRALLWHNTFHNESLLNYNFDLPCHTQYMPAPDTFTDADFEAISLQSDFTFAFAETEVFIPLTATTPCFVFVQTGNGLKGVIRIKEIIPEDTEMIDGIIYPVNPAIVMDFKFPRSFSEQKIR